MIVFLIAFLCLCLEAFFSSAEIAIVSADRAHIRHLAQQGHRGAKLVESFLQAPHRLLATTLLGTQISLVTSTVLITLWLYGRFSAGQAELYMILGMTPIVVIFGEIVPKSMVKTYANEWAPKAAQVLSLATKLMFPLVSLLSRASANVSEKLGIQAHRKLISREELEWLVNAPQKTESVQEHTHPSPPETDVTERERSMIARILELSENTATDLMVPLSGLTALPETASVSKIAKEVAEKKYSRIPIFKERLDQIVGIVHAFDVLKERIDSPKTASTLMRAPMYIPESQQVTELLGQFQKNKESMAIVVDEYGGAVGIITQEDILEEVVGEIEDEYDITQTTIYEESDGKFRVLASIPVTQLNQQLPIHIPESDEYESLAGFILEHFKRIPKPGETFEIEAATLTVLSVTSRKIEEVRIGLKNTSGN